MDHIVRALKDLSLSDALANNMKRETLKTALRSLQYFSPCVTGNPLYLTAAYLDPCRKLAGFRSSLDTKKAVKELLRINYARWLLSDLDNTWEEDIYPDYPLDTMRTLADVKEEEDIGRERTQQVIDEFKVYIQEAVVEVEGLGTFENIIHWWSDGAQRKRFPVLSLAAIDIFSVPVATPIPGHLFTTDNWKLGAQLMRTMSVLYCLAQWDVL